MQPLTLHSYERKIVIIFILLLCLCGLIGFQSYREKQAHTVYLETGKQILTGSSSQVYTQTEKYYVPCRRVYDDTMYVDEWCVVQEAAPGVRELTTLVSYYNGREQKTRILEENIVVEAVPRVLHIGTMERPQYIIPMADYSISSYYGPRWGRNHDGVDMAASVGTNVIATASGTVTRAEYYGGYGYCIDIDHGGGVLSRYGHLSRIDVSVGQTVAQGEQIGLSGNTGNSTGPHLHFEIRIDGEAVNPFDYLHFE